MQHFIERPRSSCALGGAIATLTSLPRVIPILHTSGGCGQNLSGAFASGGGNYGSGYCGGGTIPTSTVSENEIIFGGEDRLREEIENTLDVMNGELFVVATGCMTEMIGDDAESVVEGFRKRGVPIVAISTPSFVGDSYCGYEIALNGIFNQYLEPNLESAGKRAKAVPAINIFGVIPAYDPFFRGDLEEISRLLGSLGYAVNTFFTPDQTFENILRAPSAALNIVFSRTYGIGFAERFRERYGTPYWLTDMPIGPEATDRFLLEFAERTGASKKKVRDRIAIENKIFYKYFERTADIFRDSDFKYYTVTVTNSNYAIPVAGYLMRELGWVLKGSYVTDILEESQKKSLNDAFDAEGFPIPLRFETDTGRIAESITRSLPEYKGSRYYNAATPLFIVGSTLEKATAAARGAGQLSVSYPAYNRMIVDRGYAGYRGGLHLFEDIVGTLVGGK
ncbi:MAG: hypothetical protein LBP30_01335 [Clostridiales Family XIII bacterium]|nr:hypothetical protein [Clostridiales Family XIII bacterium]